VKNKNVSNETKDLPKEISMQSVECAIHSLFNYSKPKQNKKPKTPHNPGRATEAKGRLLRNKGVVP